MRSLFLILLLCQFTFSQTTKKAAVEILSGPSRVVELEVNNVAKHYNNSVSTPIASHNDLLYWVYVANDSESSTYNYIQLHQIEIPEERNNSPYTIRASYNFINNFGETDHELRVRDKVLQSDGSYNHDNTHSAPSVGVDKDGYIHVLGGMHHGPDWEYCVSSQPNDISNFDCLAQDSDRLPPYTRASYPQFFKHVDGSLYVTYRSRFSSDWHPGTSFSVLAKYDENTKKWNALGGNNYEVGDYRYQDQQTPLTNTATTLHELDLWPNWDENNRPEPLKAHLYSDKGVYHRYYRAPITGEKLTDYKDYSVTGYAYQAYWPSVKIDNDRIHFCVVVFNSSDWTKASQDSEEGADATKQYIINKKDNTGSYIYTEKEFINNYDYGTSIIYAYSDDGGETFYAPNGEKLDAPIAPNTLNESNGELTRVNASIENGAIVRQDYSSKLFTNIWPKTRLAILPDGNPIIHFVENFSDGSANNDLNSMIWNGQEWVESSSTRDSGSLGGIVSDATGGLWLFESQQATNSIENGEPLPERMFSAGSKILYSSTGINGPWEEISSSWKNGNRVDTYQASTSNMLRYVEMDIQLGGTARIVSLIPSENALSTKNNFLSSKIKLYPNPVSDMVFISSNGSKLQSVKIYDVLGKELYKTNTNAIDVSNFVKGIYFFRLEIEGKTVIKKVLVQ